MHAWLITILQAIHALAFMVCAFVRRPSFVHVISSRNSCIAGVSVALWVLVGKYEYHHKCFDNQPRTCLVQRGTVELLMYLRYVFSSFVGRAILKLLRRMASCLFPANAHSHADRAMNAIRTHSNIGVRRKDRQ